VFVHAFGERVQVGRTLRVRREASPAPTRWEWLVESRFPFASRDSTVISPVGGFALPPTNRLSRTSALAIVAPEASRTATEATPSAAKPAKRPPTQDTLTGSSGDGSAGTSRLYVISLIVDSLHLGVRLRTA
jgi:hypothetical protein